VSNNRLFQNDFEYFDQGHDNRLFCLIIDYSRNLELILGEDNRLS